MRQVKCAGCGVSASVASTFLVNDASYCEPCADKTVASLQAQSAPLRVIKPVDPTICAHCGADNGSMEYPRLGNLHFCQACSEQVTAWPFPTWLKASLAGLGLLLALALWNGRPYFRAGRSQVLGERLVSQGRYGEAIPHLQDTLRVAPQSQKAILLTAKSYLLIGEPGKGFDATRSRAEYDKSDLFNEVQGIFDRVDKALTKADEAKKLADERKYDAAARLMREAAALYPELTDLARGAHYFEVSEAFERKDYDRFVVLAEQAYNRDPKSPDQAAELASALACKYAVTGDPAFRSRAEQLLEQARLGSQSSAELKTSYEEYSERIRYRLKSREIIDRDEYDRRFRKKEAKKE